MPSSPDRIVSAAHECLQLVHPTMLSGLCLLIGSFAVFHILMVQFNWIPLQDRVPMIFFIAGISYNVVSHCYSMISKPLEARGGLPDVLLRVTIFFLCAYYYLGACRDSLLPVIALATGTCWLSISIGVSQVLKWYFMRLTSLV